MKKSTEKLIRTMSQKWKGAPKSHLEAGVALTDRKCPMCRSDMLLSIIRPPSETWRAHCNHCGSEFPIAVILNREAWRLTARIKR